MACKTLAVSNDKGGVGKTVTAVELAYELARGKNGQSPKRVMLIDLDGQANASKHLLGYIPAKGIYDLMKNPDLPLTDFLLEADPKWGKIVVLPGTRDLHDLQADLSNRIQRELILDELLEPVKKHLDYIVIDTPPSLDIRTISALCTADFVLTPTVTETWGLDGVQTILTLVKSLKKKLNPKIEHLGVLVTRYEKGNSNSIRDIVKKLKEDFGEKYLGEIYSSVKVLEAISKKSCLQQIDSSNRVTIGYQDLTAKVSEVMNG